MWNLIVLKRNSAGANSNLAIQVAPEALHICSYTGMYIVHTCMYSTIAHVQYLLLDGEARGPAPTALIIFYHFLNILDV